MDPNGNGNGNFLYRRQQQEQQVQPQRQRQEPQQQRQPPQPQPQPHQGESPSGNTHWLQHMIINQINPLPNNLTNVNTGNSSSDVGNAAVSNQETSVGQQQQYSIQIQQQQQHQQQQSLKNNGTGAAHIAEQQQVATSANTPNDAASQHFKQEHRSLNHPLLPRQQQMGNVQGQQSQQHQHQGVQGVPNANTSGGESLAGISNIALSNPILLPLQQVGILQAQQQRNLQIQRLLQQINQLQQQLLTLSGLTSQPQLSSNVQTVHQPQQQQQTSVPSLQSNRIGAIPNMTLSGGNISPSVSLQQQLLHQQQQLLLLTLVIQQISNSNENAAIDMNTIMTALTTPQNVQLLNSNMVVPQTLLQQNQQVLHARQENQQQPSLQPSSNLDTHPVADDVVSVTSTIGTEEANMSNENENENHSLLLSQQSSLPLVPQQPHLAQPRNTRGDSDASNIIGAINQGFTACANTAAGSDSALTNAHHVGSFATTEGSEGQNYSHIRGGLVSKTKTGKNKSDKEAESRFPRILYNEADDNILGEYQSLLRKQLELFEADEQDVINGTFRQGRTNPIKLGQIGLRCRHCAVTPVSIRTKGSVYCKF